MGFQPRRDTVAFLHPATSRHPHPPKLQKITHTPRLILVYDEMIKQLTLELTDLAKKAVPSLLALQGLGALTAAKILGEVGDIRRFPSRSKFASYCGVAPVEASSGERVCSAPGSLDKSLAEAGGQEGELAADLGGGPVAVPLDEPLVVVALYEGGDHAPSLLQIS